MLTTITPLHGRQERCIMSHATACTEHQLTPSAIIVTEHMVQFERRAFYTQWAELAGTFPCCAEDHGLPGEIPVTAIPVAPMRSESILRAVVLSSSKTQLFNHRSNQP